MHAARKRREHSHGLIFFATDGRFYLIDERLGLQPIGLKVQDVTLGTGPGTSAFNRVQAAVHVEAEREVRFYVQDPLSLIAAALVYNYQVDQWAFDLISDFSGGFPDSWAGACFSDSLRCFVLTPTRYTQDTGTQYFDGPDYIPLQVRTAWIQPAGSQDYSRFRYAQVLGRVAGQHNLTVSVRVDFDETTVAASGTWTAAQLAPVASTVYPEQVRLQVGTQKTQAVKIIISDAAPAGATTGQGPQLVGLALEMLPLGGMRRLPDTRKK
jgi:hypothetical protein